MGPCVVRCERHDESAKEVVPMTATGKILKRENTVPADEDAEARS